MVRKVMVKALKVGTVSGGFGIAHVDPNNPKAKMVEVDERAVPLLVAKGYAKVVKTKVVDDDDEDAAPKIGTTAAAKLEGADHGKPEVAGGGDTRDTAAHDQRRMPQTGEGTEGGADADAPPAGGSAEGANAGGGNAAPAGGTAAAEAGKASAGKAAAAKS